MVPGSVGLPVGVLLFTASESPAGACLLIMVFITAIAALHVRRHLLRFNQRCLVPGQLL